MGDAALTDFGFGLVSLSQLVETSRAAATAFGAELACRSAIVGDALHATTRDQQLVYLAAWIHQPFVSPLTAVLGELLDHATGSKPSA